MLIELNRLHKHCSSLATLVNTSQLYGSMMAGTLSLAILIVGFFIFLLYALTSGNKVSKKKFILVSGVMWVVIISLFFITGFQKLNADLSRIIHNSAPKQPFEIYTLLFGKQTDSCLTIVHLKDQVVPQVDCCIWMEVKVCPTELMRLAGLKKYTKSLYSNSDSLIFLQTFDERPKWWSPQNLGDSITMLHIEFNRENQQSIFFTSDSSHLFICDQAL
jgi:hypothetical protein